ncbi:hypothetical protein Nepgr_019053 [Nepenthes gracilis]|uniref:Uncharacterized protein n=1 Tax=Nepenthes gracilis TaxID=150966 RepID=A0AAD3SUA2_NEPGR|nr:hypothetical protein Nepgr_019053 [Nepenthes gracilis]
MEEDSGGIGNGRANWWWVMASTAQLAWAIGAYRKGYAGESRLMPIKAFGVASLFVGSGASAAIGTFKSFGIHNVEDVKEVGANVRAGLRIPPRNTG